MAINWFSKKEKSAKQQPPSAAQTAPDTDVAPQAEEPAPAAGQPARDAVPQQGPSEEAHANDPPSPLPSTAPDQRKGLFARLRHGLTKTRDILTTDIEALFSGKARIDDDLLEELEELLIASDIGVQTAMDLIQAVQRRADGIQSPEDLKEALRDQIKSLFAEIDTTAARTPTARPHIVMVVGVNGVGKTTTIGKLAARAARQGEKVLIAAADTFRAAAVEQLSIWAERAGAEIVKHKENADPAAVAYDAIEAALARRIDKVFVDTAGRLHTKVNLMEELKKIKRSIAKKAPDAPHEILLVLDATTGQNALSQAQLFHEAIGVTGLALTKLDGTAKGGIVIRISQTLKLPLQYIGVGESLDDLQPFDPQQFVQALF